MHERRIGRQQDGQAVGVTGIDRGKGVGKAGVRPEGGDRPGQLDVVFDVGRAREAILARHGELRRTERKCRIENGLDCPALEGGMVRTNTRRRRGLAVAVLLPEISGLVLQLGEAWTKGREQDGTRAPFARARCPRRAERSVQRSEVNRKGDSVPFRGQAAPYALEEKVIESVRGSQAARGRCDLLRTRTGGTHKITLVTTTRGKAIGTSILLACLTIAVGASGTRQSPSPTQTRWLVAHRGASAYAPENTVPAFRVAAEQRATFVEFDLQLTKDRQLVCLHDNSLERTTDIETVFPDRFRSTGEGAAATRRWMLADFTLAEVRQLDAGSWFDAKFRGTRVPTFAETIDALRGRSGLYIEIKSPELYEGIERLIMSELEAKGLARPGADAKTPVLLQSFSAPSLQIFAGTLKTTLPIHFLVSARDAAPWLTPEGLQTMRAFATGISPEKTIVANQREAMARAKTLGLLVTPYTFRASAVTGFPDVRAEMAHFLDTLGVDGVITDNPDLMPVSPAR